MRPGRLLSAAMLVLLLASPALASFGEGWGLGWGRAFAQLLALAVAAVTTLFILIDLSRKVFRSGRALRKSLVISAIAYPFVAWAFLPGTSPKGRDGELLEVVREVR